MMMILVPLDSHRSLPYGFDHSSTTAQPFLGLYVTGVILDGLKIDFG
jgi:hypothetical protein